MDSQSGTRVSSIAGRFKGTSQPVGSELAFQAGLKDQDDKEKRASKEAKHMQATRKGKADEWLLEFERNRRLEAEALRRAEMEAKNALRRSLYFYSRFKGAGQGPVDSGGKALILALERAKLGLSLTEAQQRMIRDHQTYLEERAAGTLGDDDGAYRDSAAGGGDSSMYMSVLAREEAARAAMELRAMLDPAAIEASRARALAEADREGEEQVESYYHNIESSQQGPPPPLPPRTQSQSQLLFGGSESGSEYGAPVVDEETAAEAASLMAGVTELLRERGMGITVGELSPLLAARYSYGKGRSWGEVWEQKHGPLLRFLKANATPGLHVVTGNKCVSLVGQPLPPLLSPPSSALSSPGQPQQPSAFDTSSGGSGGSRGYGGGYNAVDAAFGYGVTPHGYGGYASGGRHMGPGSFIPQGGGPGGAMGGPGGGGQWSSYAGGGGDNRSGNSGGSNPALSYFQTLPSNVDPFDLSSLASASTSTAAVPSAIASVPTQPSQPSLASGRGEGADYYLQDSQAQMGPKRRSFATETSSAVDYLPSATTGAGSSGEGRGRGGSYSASALAAPPPPAFAPPTSSASSHALSLRAASVGNDFPSHGGVGGHGYGSSSGGGYRSSSAGMTTMGAVGPRGGGHGSLSAVSDAQIEEMARKALDKGYGESDTADDALTWQDFDVLFRPILNHFTLYKHGRSGPAKRHNFWCNSALTRLYWDTTKFLDVLKTGERHLELADVIALINGVGTDNLRKRLARGDILAAHADRCFSLVTTSRTFDLQAVSVAQKKVLVRAFNFLLKRLQMRSGAGGAGAGAGPVSLSGNFVR